MTGNNADFQQALKAQIQLHLQRSTSDDSDDSVTEPRQGTKPTTLGAHTEAGCNTMSDQAAQPKLVGVCTQPGSDTATFMPPIQVAGQDRPGWYAIYKKVCPYDLYWVPGFLGGAVGILLIVLGSIGLQDASSSEYVSATCSFIEGTWQQSCRKSNEKNTCSYSCFYVLESDVTGSERFGSIDMTSTDGILGTGSENGCTDFSCVVDVRAALWDQSLGDIKRCGGGPCGPCSISGECSGCVGASLMKSEACSGNCSGLQKECYAKQKDGKVHQLTLRSQDEEKGSATLILTFGCIFAFCGLCCVFPCGIWCGMKS